MQRREDSDSIGGGRRERKKQAPPRRPTFKRFKTQTKERQGQLLSSQYNKNAPKETPEIGLSSLDDDLTTSHALRLGQNSSQNKALLVYSSVNEEFAKVSDAGLQELSIVESEQHNSHEGETPAAHFKKNYGKLANSFGKEFKHYVKSDQNRIS